MTKLFKKSKNLGKNEFPGKESSVSRGSYYQSNFISFPEFISTHQKPGYSINFFVRYSQFQSPATRVGTTIYDHIHPSIFQSTFNFDEFVSTCKKIRLFHLFVLEILFKNPQSDWPKTHISGTKLFQDFSKHTAIYINFYYRPN